MILGSEFALTGVRAKSWLLTSKARKLAYSRPRSPAQNKSTPALSRSSPSSGGFARRAAKRTTINAGRIDANDSNQSQSLTATKSKALLR